MGNDNNDFYTPAALRIAIDQNRDIYVRYALHMALSFPRANDRLIRHLIGVILKKIPITLYSCMKHWRDLLRINPFVDRRRRSYSDSKLFTN